jgi:hypothetical protein
LLNWPPSLVRRGQGVVVAERGSANLRLSIREFEFDAAQYADSWPFSAVRLVIFALENYFVLAALRRRGPCFQ